MSDIVQPDGTEGDKPDIVVIKVSEAARAEAIRQRIESIVNLPHKMAHDHSVAISVELARLGMMTVMPDEFAEFTDEARMAVSATRSALEELRNAKRIREAEDREREIAERTEGILQAERAKQSAEQRRAFDVIKGLQAYAATQGTAAELRAAIDAVGATSITENEFGMTAQTVRMAQTLALDTLRVRYEKAVIAEGASAMAQSVNEEFAPTARELAIAQAVRDAAFQAALECEEGHEFAAITNLDLPSIIATVKEKK